MRKILVVTDPEFSNEVVINRMREVPKDDTTFRVEHYLAPTHAKDGEAFKTALQEKKAWLERLVQPLKDEGFTVETGVHAFGKLHETIIANAVDFGADYVFKPLRHHSGLRRLMYTSTDWNLVRFCPCPLLLVGDKSEVHNKPVLASLDLESTDSAHKVLNADVLDRAKALSGLIDGQVHLVNAYNLISIGSADSSLEQLKFEAVQGARDEYFQKGLEVACANNIDKSCVHLQEGSPEIVVNQVAEQIDAGIIVLGTIARTGVSGMFIGNTAESVMEGASADVFVVKHRDFVSPLS